MNVNVVQLVVHIVDVLLGEIEVLNNLSVGDRVREHDSAGLAL